MHYVAYGGGGIITLYSQQIQNKNWCSAVQCIKSEIAKRCVFSRRLKIPIVSDAVTLDSGGQTVCLSMCYLPQVTYWPGAAVISLSEPCVSWSRCVLFYERMTRKKSG